MVTGPFSDLFRTGAEKNTATELILQSLNDALGTSYTANFDGTTQLDTVVGVENLAIARAINDIWESNRRLALQNNPTRMANIFIPIHEQILGIKPTINQSLQERRQFIISKYSIWTLPPTPENVTDFLKQMIPAIFIKVVTNTSGMNEGSVPGGATVPGGVTLPQIDDSHDQPMWFSSVNTLKIQVWQPRDHNDNLLMTDADYYNQKTSFYSFLDNYLPAYVNFNSFRYVAYGAGTITTTIGNTLVVGSGTSFTTTFEVGDTFEGVDDAGNVQEYTVASITDDTHLELVDGAPSNNTTGTYRILGFILDTPQNLDNEVFGDI